jgi:membrane-associated protein
MVLHPKTLRDHLHAFATGHQVGVYALISAIIFCETGLVVTPFLPGDSLLFIVGALAAGKDPSFSLPIVFILLCLSANCGDLLNYSFGYRVGPKVFSAEKSFLFNRKHLEEAQRFYDYHGRKTIILARFVPIIRTFAPFVAGIGRMNFFRFAAFSISGGILWVVSLTMAGYLFGSTKFVSEHFELVVLAIVFISILPGILHALKSRREGKARKAAAAVE